MKAFARVFRSFMSCSLISLIGVPLANAEAPPNIEGATSVDISQARRLYDDGAIFIDVRDQPSWATGHIDGALHLDVDAEEFSVSYVSESLDRNTPLVFYSSSPLSVNGAIASYMAGQWGYRQVYFFRDGYYAWVAQDFPVNLPLAGSMGRVGDDRVVNR